MCGPLMFVAAAGVTAAGSAYSASQEAAAGKSEQAYYDAQASTSKMQADIATKVGAERDTLAQDQGAMNAKVIARNYAVQGAAQRAALAANGQGGSVNEQNVVGDTQDKLSLDKTLNQYNANAKSWEAKTNAAYESWSDMAQANQYTAAGINARKAANAKANATLLSGASQIAGMGLQYGMYASPSTAPGGTGLTSSQWWGGSA